MSFRRSVKKQVKKKPLLFLTIIILFALGCVGGYFACSFLTKNDVFEIIGEQTITINIGEVYQDQGAKAISFGKDVSNQIQVENTIDNTKEGKYYIKYTINNFRYRGVVKYRYVIVLEAGNE